MPDYTSISASRTDADSPVDEDLALDLADNDKHHFDHALRCGTLASGVRLAFARGLTGTITIATGAGGDGTNGVTVTFATHALDGDPNFDVAPIVHATGEELSSGVDLGAGTISAWVGEGGSTTTTVPLVVGIRGGPASQNVDVRIHWSAVAPVTSGE